MSPLRNPESDNFSLDSTSQPTVVPKRKPNILRIPLGDDGKLDTSRVTPNDVVKVKQALGIEEKPPEKTPVKINRAFIPTAYSLLEVVIRRVGRFALKWPEHLAGEMKFSPEKKEALIEPTAIVLERYAPSWLIENQDIAALGAALTDAVDDMVQKGTQSWAMKYPDEAVEMLAKMGILSTEHGSNGVDKSVPEVQQ